MLFHVLYNFFYSCSEHRAILNNIYMQFRRDFFAIFSKFFLLSLESCKIVKQPLFLFDVRSEDRIQPFIVAFYVELSGWRAKLMQDRRLAGPGLPVSVFIRVSANLHTSVRPAQNSAQDHTKCLLMARSKPFLVLGLTWSPKFLQRWYVGRDKNKRSRFPAGTPLSAIRVTLGFSSSTRPLPQFRSIKRTRFRTSHRRRSKSLRFEKEILPSQVLDSQPRIFLVISYSRISKQRNRYVWNSLKELEKIENFQKLF